MSTFRRHLFHRLATRTPTWLAIRKPPSNQGSSCDTLPTCARNGLGLNFLPLENFNHCSFNSFNGILEPRLKEGEEKHLLNADD